MNFDAFEIVSVSRKKTFVEITYTDDGETEVPGRECVLIEENAQLKMNLGQPAAALFDDVAREISWIDQMDAHTFKMRVDIRDWEFDDGESQTKTEQQTEC
jgi:hypothetical protein